MWWHGGAGLKERSERGTLSAVATHDVFGVLILILINSVRDSDGFILVDLRAGGDSQDFQDFPYLAQSLFCIVDLDIDIAPAHSRASACHLAKTGLFECLMEGILDLISPGKGEISRLENDLVKRGHVPWSISAERFSPPNRERGTLISKWALMSGSERRLVRLGCY